MSLPRLLTFVLASALALSLTGLRGARTQTGGLRRVTNTSEEGININPSISGDGRILAFESTEDVAHAGGTDHFRAIRANIATDPATFFQMGGTRAVAPAISQDGSRIAFASKDDPLGANLDGNSEIFLFDSAKLIQVTDTSPGDLANRVTNGNFQPSITDDGRFIAFSSNRDLAAQNSDGNLEIFIYDTIAGSFTQLTNSSGVVGASDAKISGNGGSVAYIRDAGATPSSKRDLLEQPRVGSGPASVLASNVQSLAMTYGRAISDDGTRVVYSAETATNSTEVFLFDGRFGAATRQITSLGVRTTEVPLHPTISGDGLRIAFATRRSVSGTTSNSDGSVELYVFDIPSAQISKITDAPSGVTADVLSSLNDDGSIAAFNFPRVLSGPASNNDAANNSEIYVMGTPARPPFGVLTVLNGAALGKEPSPNKAVAPDSIAVAIGGALANSTQQPQLLPNGTFPSNVGGTTVTVNGRAAQIFFVSPGQVNFLVPPQTEIGTADVVVTNSENFASRGTVPTLRAAPGVFTESGDGTGPGVILNRDTLQEGPFDPTSGNLRLIIFATGARNATQNSVVIDGRVVAAESVIALPDMPGLDEVHVIVPRDLRGAGTVDLFVQSDGRAGNPVAVTFIGDSTRDILINEMLSDPPGAAATEVSGDANHDGVRDSGDDEFVELVNTTTRDIDLSGYQLLTRSSGTTTDSLRHTFAANTVVPACAAVVVFGGGAFDANDPVFSGSKVVKASSGDLSLSNTGGVVTLRDLANGIASSLSYGGSTGLNGNTDQSLTRAPDKTGSFVLHQTASGSGGRSFSPGTQLNGGPFAPCNTFVRIDVSPQSAGIDAGAKQQFTARAVNASGDEVPDVIFAWQSSNTSVATIDQNGLATSSTAGSTEIRASARGTQSAPAILTVREIPPVLTRVDMTPQSATIPATGAQQFTARGIDQFGNEITGLTFAWESSNTNAATIDQTGLASGISAGQSTIKATSQNVSGTATLNVTAPTVVVNEVLANPPAGAEGDANHDGTRDSADDEFVELVNSTNSSIDISGWTLRTHSTTSSTETVRHIFAANTNVPAGEAMLVFGAGAFNPANPLFGCAQVVQASSGGLSLTNGGLTILVRDGSGNLVTQFSYGGSTGLNGGSTQSLTRSPDVTGNFVLHTTPASAGGRRFSSGLKLDGTPFGNCPGHPTTVTISPPANSISVRQTAAFTSQAFDQFGRAMIGVTINFASDNISVATVDSFTTNPSTGIATGNVFGHNPGTAHITASATDGAQTANSNQATLTVNGPSLTINDVSLNEGNSGTTTFTFVVSLSTPAPPGGVTFDIATQDNTATVANNDYVARSLTAQTIPAGQQTYGFDVNVNGDLSIEPNEAFSVNVTNVSGATILDGQGTATIQNDDSPVLSINDVSAGEGNSGTTIVTFTVTSTLPAPAGGITFDIATQDDTATVANNDYVARSLTSQTIPATQTSYTFVVTVNGDLLVEKDETFFVSISNVSGASTSDGQGVGTITNDDTADLVISQVYGGGGNSGAPFANDFIEVFNRGTTTVDVATWSVQYNSAIDTDNWSVTPLCPSGPCLSLPGRYFLVREGPAGTTDLPTPDAIGTIAMATTSGKVALVTSTTALNGACPSSTSITDRVGYGGTAATGDFCFEGVGPAPALGNMTADSRKSGGCVDTNDNAADFVTGSPNPRNTASPQHDCNAPATLTSVTISPSPATIGVGDNQQFTGQALDQFGQPIGGVTVAFASNDTNVASVDSVSSTSGTGSATATVTGRATGWAEIRATATNGSTNVTSSPAALTVEPAAGQLLISEFRTRGPGGAADEFVEVYNPTSSTVVIGGLLIRSSNNAGSLTTRATITTGMTLGPGCHYLFAPASFSAIGAVPPDQSFSSGITDDGGIAITRSDSATVIDAVGMSAGSAYKEGPTLTPLAGTSNQSYERKPGGPSGNGVDSNDNSSDFVLNSGTSNPQNSASGCLDTDTADLSITKTDSPDPVTVGSDITYTITVTNNGIGAAQNVVVTDNLPSSLTYVSCNSTGSGVCDGTGISRGINFSSLAVGSSATITLVATVNGTGGASISNTASVSAATSDPNSINDSSTATTTVSSADLSITKSESPDPVNAGENITYTLTVTNNSSIIPAQSVTVTDQVPASTTFVSVGSTPTGWIRTDSTAFGQTGTITFRRPTLPENATATFTITVKVDSNTANNSIISNTASITSSTPDDNTGNNSATQTTAVRTPADLSITKTVNNAAPNVGEQVTFAITVSNGGPYAATNVQVKDLLPAGLTYVSDDGAGAYVSGTGIWTVGTVNASAAATLHITATATSASINGVTNTAEITASDVPDPDSTPNNHNAAEDDQSSVTVNAKDADLSITKSDSPDPVLAGGNITYTIDVTNNGPDTSFDLILSDSVPGNTTLQSLTPAAGWICTTPGVGGTGAISCTAASIPTSQTDSFTLVVKVNAGVTGGTIISNPASVSSSTTFDPNSGNNSVTQTTTVQPSANLSITKPDSPDPVAAGNDITYTITVANGGPDAATSAAFSDTVPTNTIFRSITTPVGWTCSTVPAVGGTGLIGCTNPSFTGSSIFTLVVRVGAAVADGTSISNTASVTSSTLDPVTGDNSATQTTTAKTPLLVISQVYGAGGNSGATYTNDFVEVFNRGTTTVNFAASNYSLQYMGATGSFGGGTGSVKFDLTSGTIAPGQYFLVQFSGGANGIALPTPDATGSIIMAATAGKVALVRGTTALSAVTCPSDSTIADFVGYGTTANCFEGAGPTPAPSTTNAAIRGGVAGTGCTDTNNNNSDFTAAPVSPHNTASSTHLCP